MTSGLIGISVIVESNHHDHAEACKFISLPLSSMFLLLYFISKILLNDCAVMLYTNFCVFMLIPSNQYNAYMCFPHFTAFNTPIVLQQYSQLSEVNEPWNFFPCIKPLAALFHCHGFCFYPACVYVGGNVH